MLVAMTPLRASAAAACAVIVAACGGSAFTVATVEAVGPDATVGDASDAAPEADATETAPDATGDGGADVTGPISDGAPEASVDDAQWVPDVIEEPPAHCATSFACAPAVPSGWSGPMEIYAGAMPPAGCSPNFEGPVFAGGNNPTADGASCTCGCGGPQNVQCSVIDISFFAGFTCTTPLPCAQKTLTPNQCTRVNGAASCDAGTASIRMPTPLATGGSCTPVLGKSVPPPSWDTSARACLSTLGRAASDCPAGQVCTPLPSAPFSGSVCIAQAGIGPCPSIGYTVRRMYYGGFDDSRDCSACSCGDVSGATCSANLEVFAPSATSLPCTNAGITYPAPETCAPVQQPGDFRLGVSVQNAGSCIGAPVTPIGGVSPSEPTTFCCLP